LWRYTANLVQYFISYNVLDPRGTIYDEIRGKKIIDVLQRFFI